MSFAQEMKDFIAGYQAVSQMGNERQKMKQDKEQNDTLKAYYEGLIDVQRQQLDLKKQAQLLKGSGAGSSAASTKAAAASEKAAAASAKAVLGDAESTAKNQPEFDPSVGESLADGIVTSDGNRDKQGDADAWAGGFADGGMVKRYAGGGTVEPAVPDPTMDQAPAAPAAPAASPVPPQRPTTALPTAPQAAGPAGAPASKPAPPPEATKLIVAGAGEAAATAMKSMVAEAKGGKQAVGGAEPSGQDLATNKGGLSPQEYDAALKTIDPNGQLPTYMKTAAVLDRTYKYFMEHGQPEKAAKIAKAVIIFDKQAAQTLGSLSMHAAEQGDWQSACKLFNDACNRFPSGHEVTVKPGADGILTYQVTDHGKPVESGKMDTRQFWQLATGVADGSLYVNEMARFAASYDPNAKTAAQGQAVNTNIERFDAYKGQISTAAAEFKTKNEAYETALSDFGDGGDRKQLEQLRKDAVAARDALVSLRKAALTAGMGTYSGKGDKGTFAASIRKEIDAAMAKPPVSAVAALPAEQEQQPGMWDTVKGWFGGSNPQPAAAPNRAIPAAPAASAPAPSAVPVTPQGNGKPVPEAIKAQAMAAINAGADKAAVLSRLQDMGYSVEGF